LNRLALRRRRSDAASVVAAAQGAGNGHRRNGDQQGTDQGTDRQGTDQQGTDRQGTNLREDAQQSASACDGRLQGIAGGAVIGWAWNPEAPLQRLEIAVVVDGEIVVEGSAEIERKDLAELGIGDGAHGFMVRLPQTLQTPARHRVLVLAGPARVPLTPSASFWQEPAPDGSWSDVVFEPGGELSAKVASPPESAESRAVVAAGWLLNLEEEGYRAPPGEPELQRLVALLSANASKCEALGIAYVPALIPRKREVVTSTSAQERQWVTKLRSGLRDEDSVELLDLLEVLREDGARHGGAYHRTDSDWNDRGAFYAARALLKEAHKRVAWLRPPTLADVHLRTIPGYRGDLADASKLEWTDAGWQPCEPVVEAELAVAIDPSRLRALRMPVEAHLAEAAPVHLRIYASAGGDEEARLAVVGDAAALALVPWLAEQTSRTTFFWTHELPLLQLELELPRVVLHLLRETDLIDAAQGEASRPESTSIPPAAPRLTSGAMTAPEPTSISPAAPRLTNSAIAAPPTLPVPALPTAPRMRASMARAVALDAQARLRAHAWTIALVLALTILSWPVTYVTAAGGLDDSWVVGLNLALAHGLTFGRQVIFTYGPLGLGLVPTAVTAGTFFLGELLVGLIQLVLVALLLANLRRRMNLLAAAVLTLLAASLVGWRGNAEPLDGIAFGLVALTYATPAARREQAFRRLALWGGVFASFALLMKLNDGVLACAVLAVGLLGSDRPRRDLTRAAASVLGTLLVLWLLLGEPLAALPDYLRNGYDVIDGYVEAMGIAPEAGGQWQLLLILGSALVLTAGAWRALATERTRRGAALAGAVLVVHYFVGREALVRYGPGHMAVVSVLGAVALMIPWPRTQRATGLAMAAMLAVTVFAVLARPVNELIDPVGDAHRFFAQAADVLHPAATIAQGRESVRKEGAIPTQMALALRGHCVTSEPDEISAVWAHPQWRWCPLPVFQSYTAYTPRLDHLNAAAYADARNGPDRVLRQVNQAIDSRNASWESPAAMLSMLCHFGEIEHSGEWQTLARVPNRCGKSYELQTIHSSLGDTIALPAPPMDAVMVAAIDGVQVAGWERLETLFTRARPRYVIVNGSAKFRVPPGTAADGLILAVPPYADYAAPFNLNMDAHTLNVEVEGHSSGAIAVHLLAVPIA
jgi:hypothetical protein